MKNVTHTKPETLVAYALIVDDKGSFKTADLVECSKESYLWFDYENPIKLTIDEALEYAESVEATDNPLILQLWKMTIENLGDSEFNFYDVTGDFGEAVIIAAIPKNADLSEVNILLCSED